ncbi:hypothetical protein QFC20_000276 [Naganishia adeliensis]|uniref:Uncharacterized protein n=1 Tax=Naganishia adeliensis TaxID=92952 RepID=A0ACC2X330_9TREE|nr:hypothetical protein QFC20_000276 [Naganishia adeliensis]
MGGSSIRNSVHRRNHKERAQPAARKRLGLLEKHKDYVLRARDYKSKKNRLRNLQEKIALRNKDEFYWGMVKGKTKKGIHVQSRGNEALPMELVKLLKTQDAGYIRTQIASDESKIAAIREQLHALADLIPSTEESIDDDDDSEGGWGDLDDEDEGMGTDDDDIEVEQLLATGVIAPPRESKGKQVEGTATKGHVIFTDDKEELLTYERTPSVKAPVSRTVPEQQSTTPQDFGWKDPSKKGKKAQQQAAYKPSEEAIERFEQRQAEREKALVKQAKLHRKRLLTELTGRVERVAKLRGVESHMSLQRNMMNGRGGKMIKQKGGRVVHEEDDEDPDAGVTTRVEWQPKIVKWKAERKR